MTDGVSHICSFLVKELKSAKKSSTVGTVLPKSGKLFQMLDGIFEASDQECNIDIVFKMAANGSQKNPSRDLIAEFSETPSLATATLIAHKLELVTTKRSGLGLLFLVRGLYKGKPKVVISRFPADSGILADEKNGGLSVEYLERVFMKSARSYKAVAYKNVVSTSSNWKGKAVDKQINDVSGLSSEYWIFDFLESDFVTTSVAGTKRMAEALKKAATISKSLDVKQQIAGAGMLLSKFAGSVTSIEEIAKKLNFTDETIAAIKAQLKNPSTYSENFKFEPVAFSEHFKYRSIVLDNGGVLTADAVQFADVFHAKSIGDKTQFQTTGRVVDERIVRRRIGAEK